MEPVLNMVHNPAPHLRTIQEKASVEVILGVWYLVTTFLYLLIDVVLECAHTYIIEKTHVLNPFILIKFQDGTCSGPTRVPQAGNGACGNSKPDQSQVKDYKVFEYVLMFWGRSP